jgi:hypothetical protein
LRNEAKETAFSLRVAKNATEGIFRGSLKGAVRARISRNKTNTAVSVSLTPDNIEDLVNVRVLRWVKIVECRNIRTVASAQGRRAIAHAASRKPPGG